MDEETRQRIQSVIDENQVVVFMKGSKNFPQCGFSATVVEVMKRLNVDFHDINVLADPAIREGVKEFTQWPTIPQVYVKGKFIGGCDIVREMYSNGELAAMLNATESAG